MPLGRFKHKLIIYWCLYVFITIILVSNQQVTFLNELQYLLFTLFPLHVVLKLTFGLRVKKKRVPFTYHVKKMLKQQSYEILNGCQCFSPSEYFCSYLMAHQEVYYTTYNNLVVQITQNQNLTFYSRHYRDRETRITVVAAMFVHLGFCTKPLLVHLSMD